MLEFWKVMNSETVLNTQWFQIRKDQCKTAEGVLVPEYYTWHKRDCIIVFPITVDQKVILVEQYRHGVKQVTLDYPGGTIEKRQSVLSAADAELIEETGFAARKYVAIGTYLMDSSYSDQRVHFVIALGCQETKNQPNPHEVTRVITVPLKEIEDFSLKNISCLLCSHISVMALRAIKEENLAYE